MNQLTIRYLNCLSNRVGPSGIMSFNFDLGISSSHIPYNVLPWYNIVQSRGVARQPTKEQANSPLLQIWLATLSFSKSRGKIFSGRAVKHSVFSKVYWETFSTKYLTSQWLPWITYSHRVISLTWGTETKLTNQTKQEQWRLVNQSVCRYKILEARKWQSNGTSFCICSTLFSASYFFVILRLWRIACSFL